MILQDPPDAEHLMEFMYHAAIGVIHADLAGNTRMLNPVAVQLLMPLARRGDILGNLFVTLDPVVPDLPLMIANAGSSLGTIIDRHRVALPAGVRGHSEPVYLSLSVVKVAQDALIATIEDVSVAVIHEHLLGQQEAWINAMHASSSRHGQVLLDDAGQIAGWNAAMHALTGFDAPAILGKPYGELFAPDAITADRMRDRLDEVDRAGLSVAEGQMRRADRTLYWGHSVLLRAEPAQGRGFTLLVRDISDHRETIESLIKAATSDQLTGVANRRALYEAANIELARFERKPRDISLLMLDIDHFKQINDTHGHPAGDQVIRNLASVLVQSVRSIDTVARIGGEEFAVLLPSTDRTMAVRIAERIRENVAAQKVEVGQSVLNYRVSIGIAQVTLETRTIDDLIIAADLALYDAKRQGRNRVCFRD